MFWLTIQTALLILAAFILGAVLGCIARQFFANARTRATGTDPARAAPAPMTATAAAARAAARTTDAEAGAAGEVVAADSGAAPAAKAETAVTEVAAPVAATAAGDAEPAGAESAEAETAETEAEATEAEAEAAGGDEAEPMADGAGADDEDAMAARLAALPQDASPAEKADAVGNRPVGLGAARGGKADDLKRIRGIGKVNEKKLGDLGVYHFDQIAAWTAAEVRWVGTFLSFAGRIEREEWVAQAARLARGEETDFSKRVDEGDVPSSKD